MTHQNIIDQVVGYFAPVAGNKRAVARMQMRHYEAANTEFKSKFPNYIADSGSGDAEVERAGLELLRMTRYLDSNYDLVTGILDTFETFVIGADGLKMQPNVKLKNGKSAVKTNNLLEKLYTEWCKNPEVTGEYSMADVEQMSLRSCLRDGEMFTQKLTGPVSGLTHSTKVPYSIELIETDFCPLDYSDESKRITQGITKNEWLRPQAYHFYKKHPGDFAYSPYSLDTKSVPAENIVHYKRTKRFGQTRGVTIFHSALTRLMNIKDYEASEQFAARISAAMVAYIKKHDTGENVDMPAERSIQMQPGMIYDGLKTGEEVGMIESKRPNTMIETYRNTMVKGVNSGTRSGFSSTTRNYNGSFSAQRQELVEQWRHYLVIRGWHVRKFTYPIYMGFVKAAVLAGLLDINENIDLSTIMNAEFRGPAMPWIDPVKEARAIEIKTQLGHTSLTRAQHESGVDPEKNHDEIVEERKRAKDANLTFSSDYASVNGESIQQLEETPDDDTDPDEDE